MNGVTNRIYGEYSNAFDLISRNDPAICFETGFKGIDNIIDGRLRLGEIFEICGERHSAKFYIAHVILANVLIGQQNTESFQIFVFDYAHLFNVKLLRKLARKKSSLSDERIEELIGNVFVRNYYEIDGLYSSLKEIARVVNENRVWYCYENKMNTTVTTVFIMDIGSLLHETSFTDMQGQHVKGEIYRQFETMAKGGAFILLLNHCTSTDEQFPVYAALGRFWRELVKNRVFFVRDERDERVHVMLAQDEAGQTKRVKFRLNIRPDDVR